MSLIFGMGGGGGSRTQQPCAIAQPPPLWEPPRAAAMGWQGAEHRSCSIHPKALCGREPLHPHGLGGGSCPAPRHRVPPAPPCSPLWGDRGRSSLVLLRRERNGATALGPFHKAHPPNPITPLPPTLDPQPLLGVPARWPPSISIYLTREEFGAGGRRALGLSLAYRGSWGKGTAARPKFIEGLQHGAQACESPRKRELPRTERRHEGRWKRTSKS